MKTIKYAAMALLLSVSITACGGGQQNKTIGGTTDTMNSVQGSNSGNESATSADTVKNKDSTSQGNANPSGRMENDTVGAPK
jgi:hypothetical protein